MPDFLEPQDLVPDQGSDSHIIEEHDQEQHEEGWGFEDFEWHDGLRGVVSFPKQEAPEEDNRADQENNLIGG